MGMGCRQEFCARPTTRYTLAMPTYSTALPSSSSTLSAFVYQAVDDLVEGLRLVSELCQAVAGGLPNLQARYITQLSSRDTEYLSIKKSMAGGWASTNPPTVLSCQLV